MASVKAGTDEGHTAPRVEWLGDGKMAEAVAAKDWSQTPLGPIESWPQSLRTTVSLALASNFPISIAWGPQRTQIYNDGYWPICGAKHPEAMGQDFRECWFSAWPAIGEAFESASAGKTAFLENQPMFLDRHGYLEETFFTFSFSPIRDETGRVAGLFHPVTEMTAQMLAERRLQVLREVSDEATEAQTVDEAADQVVATLRRHQLDVPFALLYLLDPDDSAATLAAAAHLEPGVAAAPTRIDLDADEPIAWPLAEAVRTGAMLTVEGLENKVGPLGCGPYPEPPATAMVLPITVAGLARPLAVLIAGASPRRPFDEIYRTFFVMLQEAVSNCLVNAWSYEEERKRGEQLAELDRAKTTFFSNVSHEFRTPLTLMLGPVEDMLGSADKLDSEWARGQLGLVHRNSQRLLRLVNMMLDFSRIEAGRIEASYLPTDLGPFTADLASSFRSACERAGLELIIRCDDLNEPVYVDRDMWEKIVLNLVSNAFKFTLEGTIEVRLEEHEGHVRLKVRDTGVGIPENALPRLFERFYRVPQSEGRTHEGTGIGLALVRELARLHGGEVSADSVRGEGSRFIVTLPFGTAHLDQSRIGAQTALQSTAVSSEANVNEALRWLPDADTRPGQDPDRLESPPVAAVAARSGALPLDTRRPRLVWADDNADMRAYVAGLLAPRFQVEAVVDGQAALAACKRQPPDLVLSDVMMPRMDGFELLAALRADSATTDIPVILLSARAGEERSIEGLNAGADDYIVKPFTAKELIARLETHAKLAGLRREAQRGLTAAAAQFKVLIDQAPIGVFLVDAELRVREINPVARAVLGEIGANVLDNDLERMFAAVWNAERAEELVAIFRRTLESGRSHSDPEWSSRGTDGNAPEFYEWQINRIPMADGGHGVVCYLRDITANVRVRQTIEQSRQALREADHKKDAFLATLSHELRNPLAPLRTALEVAKREGDASFAEIYAVMDRQLRQLTQLVDDLLSVSRITQGKLRLRKRRVALEPLFRDAVKDCEALLVEKRHSLSVKLDDTGLELDADPVRIEQMLTNLLSNAAKYTPAGGRIELSARREDDCIRIAVRDTGVGIPPDQLDEIFDLFRQIDISPDDELTGLGIGLSLVRTLAEMHGGRIEAQSDGLGKGSEFTLLLPAAEATDVEPVVADASPRTVDAPSRRVLIIDDNRDAAITLCDLVGLLGHQARTAFDGPTGLELAASLEPDLALVDIGLPGMSGYEVARRMRAEPWGTKVHLMAVTGWAQDEVRNLAEAAGFDQHCTKPLTIEKLEAVLRALS